MTSLEESPGVGRSEESPGVSDRPEGVYCVAKASAAMNLSESLQYFERRLDNRCSRASLF